MRPHERAQALAELRRIEATLAQISGWLYGEGEERAGVLCEDAWKSCLAAQALLDRDPVQVLRIVPDGRALGACDETGATP